MGDSGEERERVGDSGEERGIASNNTLMLYSGGMDTWNVNFPLSQ